MEKKYYKQYAILEKEHWWFKARLQILRDLIRRSISRTNDKSLSILNAGVATGMTTRMLDEFGHVVSLEYDEDCCHYLRSEAGIDAIQGSLTSLPFESGTFDMVCAFDVIEHIENDKKAVEEINRVLKPGGIAFLTVPAFMFLWSDHDKINHHYRRYDKELFTKTLEYSLQTKYISYFNFLLFLPIAIVRLLSNFFSRFKSQQEVKSDFESFKTGTLSNKLFYYVFRAETKFLGKVSLPFGVSLCAICFKK